jgi:FkbM family methyltransferase
MNPWIFRSLGKNRFIRSVVKRAFDLWFSEGTMRKIPFGPIAGKTWICRSGQQFWMPLGFFEGETSDWLVKNIGQGQVFFDVGANWGYFTILGGKRVGERGRVIAFEPISQHASTIRDHARVNYMDQITVEEKAVSEKAGTARFLVERESANSHLEDIDMTHAKSAVQTRITVEVTTLDIYVDQAGVIPGVVKIDVEGAEIHVLKGAKNLLKKSRPHLLVSTHGEDLKRSCTDLLRDHGYEVGALKGFEHEIVGIPEPSGAP